MLSIDGVHIEKDLGLHLLEGSNEPILPNTRDSVVSIPGRHGAYSFKSYMAEKTFFQEVLIPTQATLRDVQRIVREISKLVLDDYGNPKEVELKWDYEPDKFYKAKFSGYISIDRIHHAGKFYLPFTAYDPFAYATVQANEIHWDSTEVTIDDDYAWGTTAINEEHITAPTTLETYINGLALRPKMTIKGSGNNVTFRANGKSFSLKNFTNDTIEINGNNYTVIKNGVNGFSDKSGDFIELLPGLNKIEISGDNMDFTLTMPYRDQYM